MLDFLLKYLQLAHFIAHFIEYLSDFLHKNIREENKML